MSDFYVGYLPKAPSALGQFVRRVVAGLGLLAVALALVLVVAQHPFANSTFEFGNSRPFEGTIAAQPYPLLFVARPGAPGEQDKDSQYLLVAPGKHGADDLVSRFDGKTVKLQGQLIYRDGRTMLEVVPGSIVASEGPTANLETYRDLGLVTVAGEIVDSKCYLGVMNPGNGKVHRDCAARCLSGGIPPLLISSNNGDQYLLVGVNGQALQRDALREFIAEPITVQGHMLQSGETRLLAIDPHALRHTTKDLR
jgi:hypothetical protein